MSMFQRQRCCLPAVFLASFMGAACLPVHATEPAATVALVTRDAVTLRAAPHESAAAQTALWRGEALEIRAQRGDHVQVWDHFRERGGYVLRSQLLRVDTGEKALPGLLTLLHFVSDQPGSETLGLALAAAAIQAMPPAAIQGEDGADVLDAIGGQAERLAERASRGAQRVRDQAMLSAHVDLARRHGVEFLSIQDGDRVRLCYEGDAHRRLLSMPAASAEQKARAALALTRPDCLNPQARPSEREAALLSHAEGLERVPAQGLDPLWRARLSVRQAAVWSALAFARAQRGDAAAAREAADRALTAVARIDGNALADDDLAQYTEAALRVNAVRWAAHPGAAPAAKLGIAVHRQDDGQTCARLIDPRQKASQPPLAERCSWGMVWAASASVNREGNAVALAVQPIEGWRELWVFRREKAGWTVQVLPPAALDPGVGYAELAGWVPGGRQILVAREALAEGRKIRRFEVVDLSTLTPQRTALAPDALGPFARWPDPAWKRDSLALR
jgi:hypothetical protein